MKMGVMFLPRAITAAFLGLALMSTALSATAQDYYFESDTGSFTTLRGNRLATLVDAEGVREDEGDYGTINIPFEFYFFGQRITKLVPTTNIFLSTDETYQCLDDLVGSCSSLSQSGSNLHTAGIYPYWVDNELISSSELYHHTKGDIGKRVFTIEYSQFPIATSSFNNALSIQVKLFENSGIIEFAYLRGDDEAEGRGNVVIGIAASADFFPDSDTARYYSLLDYSSDPMYSDTTLTPITDRTIRPESNQIYRFTPEEYYFPPPPDLEAVVSQSFSVVLPPLTEATGGVTYMLRGWPAPTATTSFMWNADTRTFSGMSSTEVPETTLTYTAVDDLNESDPNNVRAHVRTFNLTVASGARTNPTFTSSQTSDLDINTAIGEDISRTLPSASGGHLPIVYTLSPALPAGLEYNTRTRIISGTPTTAQTSTMYTYTVTDLYGSTSSVNFSIAILADSEPIPPTIEGFIFNPKEEVNVQLDSFTILGNDMIASHRLTNEAGDEIDNNNFRLIGGLSYNQDTRIIMGTVIGDETPNGVGATTYKYSATDDDPAEGTDGSDGPEMAETTFTITIVDEQPVPPSPMPEITFVTGETLSNRAEPLSLPPFTGGTLGPPPNDKLTYALMPTPALPTGVSLDLNSASSTFLQFTGTVTDTPDPDGSPGTVYTYTATDRDMDVTEATFTIRIEADIEPNVQQPSEYRDPYILETNANVQTLGLIFPSAATVGGNSPVTFIHSRTNPDFLSVPNHNTNFQLDTGWLTITDMRLAGIAPQDVSTKDESVPRFSITGTYTDANGDTDSLTFHIQVIDVRPIPPAEVEVVDLDFDEDVAITPKTLPPFTTNVDDLPLLANNVRQIPIPVLDYTLEDLPPGLTFDKDSREIRGTPTAAGITTVTYKADERGQDDEAEVTFRITVHPDMPSFREQTIDPLTLTQNTPITNVTLPKAIGKDMPLAYSISPALPSGLSFDDRPDMRVLSGTPLVDLPMTLFTYTVADSGTPVQMATLTFNITVAEDLMPTFASNQQPISPIIAIVNQPITSVNLPKVVENSDGDPIGTGEITYTITPPLPDDLIFNGDADPPTLSGTPTATQEEITYTYKATDSDTVDADSAMLTFTITVEANSTPVAPTGPQALIFAPGQQGVSRTLDAFIGGNEPVTYSSDDVQAVMDAFGLTFVPGTLMITDNINIADTPAPDDVDAVTYTYTATDRDEETASTTFTIEIVDALPVAPIDVQTPTFTRESENTYELLEFTTTVDDRNDIQAPDLTYSLGDNAPSWLSIPNPDDPIISGMPPLEAELISHTVTYIARDGADEATADAAEATFTLTVTDDSEPMVPTLPNGGVYTFAEGENPADDSFELPAFMGGDRGENDDIDLIYSLSDGTSSDVRNLRGGLVFNPVDRTITGTATLEGEDDASDNSFSQIFTYRAIESVDADSDPEMATVMVTITITDVRPDFSDETRDDISTVVGSSISPETPGTSAVTLPATTGTGTVTYALAPPFPSNLGLTFTSGTREIAGTPMASLSITEYTYTATDSSGDSDTLTFNITVAADMVPVASSIDPIFLIPGQNLDVTPIELPEFSPSNATLTYALGSTPALPSGLSFDMTSREIRGTVTADTVADESVPEMTYTYIATDDEGTSNPIGDDEVSAPFTIQIVDARPVLETTIVPLVFTKGDADDIDLPRFGNNLPQNLPPNSGITEPTFTYTLTGELPDGITHDMVNQQLTSDTSIVATDSDIDLTYRVQESGDEDFVEVPLILRVTDTPMPRPPSDIPPEGYTFTPGEIVNVILPNFTIAEDEDGSTLTHTLANAADDEIDNSPGASLIGGLEYNSDTRTISGTVDGDDMDNDVAATTYTYSAILTELPSGQEDTTPTSTTFTIEIVDEQPAFATGPTIDPISGTQGTAIQPTAPLPAVESIGSGGITYTFAPMLPNDLEFDQDTRVISGTPSAGLTETTFTYRARDVDGDITPQSFSFTITIEAVGDPVVTPIVAPTVMDFTFAAGVEVTATPETTLPAFTGGNGALTYTLAVSSAPETSVTDLVGGLEFAPNSRQITGTNADTSANENANETYTYTATDSVGTMAMTTFTITITDEDNPVAPTADQAFSYEPGEDVNITLMPFTGVSGTIDYELISTPTLPTGVSASTDFASSRVISGTVDEDAGNMPETTYTYRATAAANGETNTANFTIVVTSVPTLNMATASAIPTVGANIALVASQAISSRVELALDGLSSGIDIRTLDGPQLRLNPQQQNGGSSGSPVRFGVWYSAASDSLSDTRSTVTWEGTTDSTNLGFDVGFDISASASLVVGILQNSSSTSATYRNTSGGDSGTLSVDLDSTAFYVGLGYDWLDAWFANGSADSTLNDSETDMAIPASFSYQTIGLTASFEVAESFNIGGKVESLTSDLSLSAMDDVGYDGLSTDSSQLRTAFVANYQLKLGEKGNGLLIPKFEFGFRDLSLGTSITDDTVAAVAAVGGSAMETGFGVDYLQRAWGLTVGLDIRSISVENYSSDSTQYQIRWESGNYGSGISFQLTPHSVSETLGGIDSLYSGGYNQYQSVLERQRGGDSTQDSKGLDFEVGYGFVANYGTVTPYLKTTNYRGSGNRAQEFGIRYQTLSGLELTLRAERELTPQTIQILGFPLTLMQQENALTFNTRYSF